jgi:uncharacterized protein (DUF1330 family)
MIEGPSALNVDLLRSLPDEGPVVMINLVRFREHSLDGNGSGWDAYVRYSKGDMPLLKKVGGTIVWSGHIDATALGLESSAQWDWVVLVEYPTKAAFLEMMTSPEYQLINKDRENGVEEHVILAANQAFSRFNKQEVS